MWFIDNRHIANKYPIRQKAFLDVNYSFIGKSICRRVNVGKQRWIKKDIVKTHESFLSATRHISVPYKLLKNCMQTFLIYSMKIVFALVNSLIPSSESSLP